MIQCEYVNGSKDKCSGCGLCSLKCPKKAIKMVEDESGFLYACIDKTKCVNCNICRKICPYINQNNDNEYKNKSYIAVSKNEALLSTVASGGIFTSLAQSFIISNGIVCGSVLKNNDGKFVVEHVTCSTIEELDNIKGSKYVQSNIFNIYKEIDEALNKGKAVLFSGTPCQVAAIKKFTNNPSNLYTVDIICHGVPSVKLFNDYINFEDKKNNILIKDFKFRVKRKGWGLYYYSYNYYDNKTKQFYSKSNPAFKSSYYQMFLDGYIFRDNCYSCPFATKHRVGDLTIGDFWGIEKEHPEVIKNKKIDPYKGVSCLLINSTKGEEMINNCENNLTLIESSFSKIENHNKQLNHPCKKREGREELLKEYSKNGYNSINMFYKKIYGRKKIIKSIWYKVPYRIRKIIKR